MKKLIGIAVFILAFVIGAVLVSKMMTPKMTELTFETEVFDQDTSHVLLEGRHFGKVNLHKFLKLAQDNTHAQFDSTQHVNYHGDSVIITMPRPSAFFGAGSVERFKQREYTNLPISFPTNDSFSAEIEKEEGIKYIVIPYLILTNLGTVGKR